MKKWIQRFLQRVTRTLDRIFKPVMVSEEKGTIVLHETPTQILTRKTIAIALGSLAVSMLTNPTAFTIDESITMRIGDWLARIASNLWNYNGVATFS